MTSAVKPSITRAPIYRRQWFKRLIVAVVALLLVVAIAVIVIFIIWLNSPEKALLDTASYAAQMPGSYHITATGTDLTMTIRDEEYEMDGTLKGIPLDAILYGGALDVKSSQIDKVYDLFMGANGAPIPAVIQSILPTINNKWVQVNLENIALKAQSAVDSQCILQEKESISHDPNARRQWAMIYVAHRFLDITPTKQAGTTSYDISVNRQKRAEFFAALQKTSFYQSLTNCSQNTDVLSSLGTASPIARVTLIPSRHVLQSMVIDPNTKDAVTVTANYVDVPAITVPGDTISTDSLLLQYLGSFTGGL